MALVFLVALAVFNGLLAIGVLRGWRWTFWLILVAFLAGVLRMLVPQPATFAPMAPRLADPSTVEALTSRMLGE